MSEKLEKKEIIWIVFLAAISCFFGVLYSIYNTDPHHWGFIAGPAQDYIRGKHLFSEVYVQYGVGQSLLFRLLNPILTINYTSIGFITSMVYALNLVVIYLSARKLSNGIVAFLISATSILLHSYAMCPWPDYYVGLFLSLACYLMIGKADQKMALRYAAAGLFLFIAFLFRNTYLLTMIAAALGYGVVCIFNKQVRNKNIGVALLVFFVVSGIYLLSVFLQGNLQHWYDQGIGAGAGAYGVGLASVLTLLQRVFFPHALQAAYFPIKFAFPHNLVFYTFSLLVYLAIFIGIRFLFRKEQVEKYQSGLPRGLLVFFALLGTAGLIQATLLYEVFRLQSSCSPLYLMAAIFIFSKYPDLGTQLKKIPVRLALGLYFVLLIARFPYASVLFPLYDGDIETYRESSIPFFKWHRFRSEELAYYDGLSRLLCDGKKKIVNLTMESSIPYLCGAQENGFFPIYMEKLIKNISPIKLAEVQSGVFHSDELIASYSSELPPVNPKVKLVEIGRVLTPESLRWLGRSTVILFRVETL